MAFRFIFAPFSFIYLIIVCVRGVFYKFHILKEHPLDTRVISIGNITWGGTGKTPAVVFISQMLLKGGKRIAILTRGYGQDEHKLVSSLAPGVPVLVGRDRVKTGNEAIKKYSPDTLLLDDGFQYRRLKRDLDIVCVDATNPFGNGWIIPAGSMRESLSSLKRADIYLITKVDLADNENLNNLETKLKKISPESVIVRSIHKAQHFYKLSSDQLVDVEALKERDIVLFSAIGNPAAFEKTILNLGLKFKRHFIFRDHYLYKKKDLDKITSYSDQNQIDTIITTEKDAIKLSRFTIHDSRFTILCIRLEITDNEEGLYNRLFGIYSS